MENASKALLMAGGILIGVLILALMVTLFLSSRELSTSYEQAKQSEAIQQFNVNFTKYLGQMDKRYSQYYSLIQVVTILLFAIFLFNPTNGSLLGHQTEVFFKSCSDIFADFLNVMRYISGRDPYFNPTNGFSEKIYPPLSYLLLSPFSQLADYANMTLEECWNSKISIASCLCFTLISFWIFRGLICL